MQYPNDDAGEELTGVAGTDIDIVITGNTFGDHCFTLVTGQIFLGSLTFIDQVIVSSGSGFTLDVLHVGLFGLHRFGDGDIRGGDSDSAGSGGDGGLIKVRVLLALLHIAGGTGHGGFAIGTGVFAAGFGGDGNGHIFHGGGFGDGFLTLGNGGLDAIAVGIGLGLGGGGFLTLHFRALLGGAFGGLFDGDGDGGVAGLVGESSHR